MKLAAIGEHLRDTSARYGGIREYLAGAGALDRAVLGFLDNQDLESLTALNGAVALTHRLRKAIAPEAKPAVEAINDDTYE